MIIFQLSPEILAIFWQLTKAAMTQEHLHTRIKDLEQQLIKKDEHIKSLEGLLDKKLDELFIYYHIAKTISSVLDVQEMLRQITGIIKKTIHWNRISIYLREDSRDQIELSFFSGLDVSGKVSLRLGEGLPGRIAENGEHVHIHDLAVFYETFNDFIHYPGEARRDGSYIGIALKAQNSVIGVLGMDSNKKHGLSVDDMDLMAILSHQIAAGIERSRYFEKIQQLSEIDGLTGLYNHRVFHEKLRHEVNRRGRTGKPLSLIMLDIDHFKQFNDAYGHQAGDAVLREIAEIITSQSRCNSIDTCSRYGGEEFSIIMPEIELHNAVKVAERLRNVVEAHSFFVEDGSPPIKVTVSIGVAAISGSDDMSAEELIKKADEALYLSKRSGRNRVSYSPHEV